MKFVINDGLVEPGILLNLMATFYPFACMVSKKVLFLPGSLNSLFWEVSISKGSAGEGNYRAWVTVSVVKPISTKGLHGPRDEKVSYMPISQCANIEIHLDGSVGWCPHEPILMEKLNGDHLLIKTLVKGLEKQRE